MSTATKALHGDEQARQVMAAVFVDIMETQDTDDSLPCPIAVRALYQILFEGSSDETPLHDRSLRNRVRKHSPEVFHRMMHFLTRPRPEETRRRLAIIPMPAPGQCSCTRSPVLWSNHLVRELHALKGQKPVQPASSPYTALREILRCFFGTLGATIDYTFYCTSAKKVRHLAQEAAQNGHPATWPSCQQDMLPYGIAPSISALCAWAEFCQEICVLRGIDLVYESILIPAFFSIFVKTILPRVFLPVATAHINACERALRPGQVQPEGALREFLLLATSIAKLDELDNRQLLAATDGNLDLLKPLGDVSSQCSPLIHKMLRKSTRASQKERRELERVAPIFTTIAARIAGFLAAPELPRISGTALRRYSKLVAHGTVCARPGCGRTYFATGVRLGRCSRCMMAYYCSASCQADAWRHPALPHREVCGKLQELFAVYKEYGGDRDVTDVHVVRVLEESAVDVLGHLERLYIKEWIEPEVGASSSLVAVSLVE